MTVDKDAILKTLSAIDKFDATASPFVVLRLDNAKVYRSSSFGFISSKDIVMDKDSAFVSLGHLRDCLKAMPEDKVELELDANGVLLVKSIESTFESELRVYTISAAEIAKGKVPPMKRHELGKFSGVLKPEVFRGFDARPFQIAAPPILLNGKLLLSTVSGIIMWQGPDALQDVTIHPRDSVLRFISGGVEEVYLTDTGYWGASSGPLIMFVSGHNLSPNLHQLYNVPGDKITEFPAHRLLQALGGAASLCDNSRKVDITPDKGVTTKNSFGNPQEFHITPQKGWDAFSIFGATAKLVCDALSQTNEETAVLERVNVGTFPTMRLTRGGWSVSFKIF
jgi:hypothetical protein